MMSVCCVYVVRQNFVLIECLTCLFWSGGFIMLSVNAALDAREQTDLIGEHYYFIKWPF